MTKPHRLIRDNILPEPTPSDIEGGYVCAVCWRPTEERGYPAACEECGGDGVLDEDTIQEALDDHDQFGVGA